MSTTTRVLSTASAEVRYIIQAGNRAVVLSRQSGWSGLCLAIGEKQIMLAPNEARAVTTALMELTGDSGKHAEATNA